MTPAAVDLRPATAPTRVSELLLPTVLSLLSRNPESAAFFSTLLQPGTRVTASRERPPASPNPMERRAGA
ncbi:hypothetical protein [Amycolatopsis sp. Hca4]|uniref:hypothetical protein n=1 Tax=Amycolatopsis sp. Hca4 TaxID=2742131 RepID=UPI00158FA382|nr:hypothetical protein [Amycolatopsis sp. Hca4]QKV77597.1 hypothetical protein HUT10_30335 [Amycolatopsis sp. Hca4]